MSESPPFAVQHQCSECPWRTDVAPGRFPPERFQELARTCYPRIFPAPIFACHKTPDGQERACAGFLLVGGMHNNSVRLAVIRRRFDPRQIVASGPLYGSYVEMALANGVADDDPVLIPLRG